MHFFNVYILLDPLFVFSNFQWFLNSSLLKTYTQNVTESTKRSAINNTKYKMSRALPWLRHSFMKICSLSLNLKTRNCFVPSFCAFTHISGNNFLLSVQLTNMILKSSRWKAPNVLSKKKKNHYTVVCTSYTTSWKINRNVPELQPTHHSSLIPLRALNVSVV